MKGILSYFPVELLKMRAEKRHNAYKTQVLCIPTNKNPKISDSMDLNNSPREMLIFCSSYETCEMHSVLSEQSKHFI